MRRTLLRRIAQIGFSQLMLAAGFFLAAGRWDWPMAWVLLGVYAAFIAVAAAVLIRTSPDLIEERSRIKRDAKRWDKALSGIVGLLGPLAVWVTAGLDARFHPASRVAPPVQAAALGVALLAYGAVIWAMACNKFFSAVVRIQKERGHRVISSGPYRWVRHPGYVGMIAFGLATPLILGTPWALVPAALTAGVTLLRTALEDRTLCNELEGYRAFTAQVRWRLLPGVW